MMRDQAQDEIAGAEPWWKTNAEWLQAELDDLDRAGFRHERDEDAFAQGTAQLRVFVPMPDGGEGEELQLVVTFPDLYPYFRFLVAAPTLNLRHHQHPVGHGLCLLGRDTEHWHTGFTVARLLEEQLPKLLRTGASDDLADVLGLEQEQAEPFGDYYPYAPSLVLVDSAWRVPAEHRGGKMLISVAEEHPAAPPGLLRGTLVALHGEGGEVVAESEPLLRPALGHDLVEGVWIRVAAPIPKFDADQFLQHLLETDPRAREAPACRFGDGWLKVWGVLFPQEVGHRVSGEGWVFVCVRAKSRSDLDRAIPPAATQKLQQLRQQRAKGKGSRPKKRR